MKEKSIQVSVIGKPNIKNLPKIEAKIFYSTLLSAAIEYYSKIEEKVDQVEGNHKIAV